MCNHEATCNAITASQLSCLESTARGFSWVLLYWANLSNTLSTWSGATLLLILGTIFKLYGFKLVDLHVHVFYSLRKLGYMFSTIRNHTFTLCTHVCCTQVDLMQSLSLLSWLARMWRWTQTWPSSSPWTLAMPGGQTYQTTSSNSLGGKPIICMYTHVCCMHVPCTMCMQWNWNNDSLCDDDGNLTLCD